MKILGIVTEYNPFHNGHSGHLEKAVEIFAAGETSASKAVVAVMSGNFVQRGEPALCDKWRRTKMALMAGVDLVIELPSYYATAGAEYFARGAVTLLEKSGLTDSICFGSEEADINYMKQCATALSSEDEGYKEQLNKNLRLGLSYPAARAKAAETHFPNLPSLPDSPNNILGLEYIKALISLTSNIKAYTVPRSPGSAKDVRESLKNNKNTSYAIKNMPPYAWAILEETISSQGLAHLDNLSNIFHYILRSHNPLELQNFMDVSEGLENRLFGCSKENILISDIISAAKTKRYTFLRLQRAVLHIILGISKKNMAAYEMAGGPQYIRVLGFNKDRSDLLKMLEEKSKLPLVINLKNARLPSLAAKMLNEEVRASKIYSLAFPKHIYLDEYTIPLSIFEPYFRTT